MGEIARAAKTLSRNDANELVKMLLKKYYPQKMEKPDIGKPFPELYYLESVRPREWWYELYLKAKKEAIDYGLKLE